MTLLVTATLGDANLPPLVLAQLAVLQEPPHGLAPPRVPTAGSQGGFGGDENKHRSAAQLVDETGGLSANAAALDALKLMAMRDRKRSANEAAETSQGILPLRGEAGQASQWLHGGEGGGALGLRSREALPRLPAATVGVHADHQQQVDTVPIADRHTSALKTSPCARTGKDSSGRQAC